MTRTYLPFFLALVALALVFAGPAFAGAGEGLWAIGFSKHLSGLATRSGVIRVAAVGMLIALVIIMKKFDEPPL